MMSSDVQAKKFTVPVRSCPGYKRQQGLTMISWIVVIVFLLFQAVIAMNVIPVYLTDSSVKSILDDLPSDLLAQEASPKELELIILKRLRINNVTTVTSDDIAIKRGKDEKIVNIEYEPRGKLIGNLEYIVLFEHEVRVPNR
jgi:hypothetical protein